MPDTDRPLAHAYFRRFAPDRIRGEFVTIGVLVVDSGDTFVSYRETNNWDRVNAFQRLFSPLTDEWRPWVGWTFPADILEHPEAYRHAKMQHRLTTFANAMGVTYWAKGAVSLRAPHELLDQLWRTCVVWPPEPDPVPHG